MRASILTIGDELLIGQVLNSNTQWIGNQLTDLGISVEQHLTVGDKPEPIRGALDYLLPRSDVLLIGGGLGPTHDDITLEVLAQYVGKPLFFDQEWIDQVTEYFRSRNRPMSENNKKQALLIEGAERIDNDCGTAAGQAITFKKCQIFVFPGVPHEMKSMMERFILPRLKSQQESSGESILKETLVTTGIGESALALKCEPFVRKIKSMPEVGLAFLPNLSTVRLRLQMKSKSPQDSLQFTALLKELRDYCGQDWIGFDPTTLEEVVFEELKKRNATLALAESCTGGLIAHRLTQIPGISAHLKGALVPYQATLKTSELEIPPSTFEHQGVVSETTAKAMAWSLRKKWNVDYALSTTGYLGPSGGDRFASVGTVCMAVAGPDQIVAKTFHYEANRERAKERAAQSALDLLRRSLQQ